MTTSDPQCRVCVMTAPSPGAIGVIQLVGNTRRVLEDVIGRDLPQGRPVLVDLAGIDEGVGLRLTDDIVQLMPHGGQRVMQRLLERLAAAGCIVTPVSELKPASAYPEACDAHEARMLSMLATAASPLAIDLLLAQPARWRTGLEPTEADRDRSRRLGHLVTPPTVVVTGPPNAGKSTLTNTLVGRSATIVTDVPGTTRDYTVTPLELAGLVVRWIDTPGWRVTDDLIEAAAISLAQAIIEDADLVIGLAAPGQDWVNDPRPPDLRVGTQSDRGIPPAADVTISAVTGDGIDDLVRVVRDHLVPPEDLSHPGAWALGD